MEAALRPRHQLDFMDRRKACSMSPAPTPPFQRFLGNYCVHPDTGCWLWEGSTYQNGYGWLKVFGKIVSAHRYSYELHRGPIPCGGHILHSCDVKHCVNPDHLRVGSHAENMADAVARGRIASGPDHPAWGTSPKRPKQSHRVRVLGREFESKKSAERALGLGSGTVSYWVKNKPEKAQLLKGTK